MLLKKILTLLPLTIVLASPRALAEKPNVKNIVVIGWDGTQRPILERLLKENKLPNLKTVIASGSFVAIDINEGRTETKPGWSQIFTGYDTKAMGIVDNDDYRPIPKGQTIFERLEEKFAKQNLMTVFIGGKINNIGARGRHEICLNCRHRFKKSREKTKWWENHDDAPLRGRAQTKEIATREGEPYFHAAKAIDRFEVGVGEGKLVFEKVSQALESLKGKKFFAFFHFEEPDEQSHLFGFASSQYSDAIVQNDVFLGKLIERMKSLGIWSDSALFITSDHGQGPNAKGHNQAPQTFLVSSLKGLKEKGDRRDVSPTLYEVLGVDASQFKPKLNGKSLLKRD